MIQINPHINFNGNAEEAFSFYQSVFGGSIAPIVRFKDMAAPGQPLPDTEADKIMHIALTIGNNTLMGNDVPEILGRVNERENRSKISVSVDSREEADRIFNALSAGGTVEVPIGDSPWGTYFAMFRDQYGIEWMISYEGGQK